MTSPYLAIIPARGGSQGLPNKNLKKINNVSLVGRAVQIAKKIASLDKVLISTDSQEIAKEAIFYGAGFISLRPDTLATSSSTAIDTWRFTWTQAEQHFNKKYDWCFWLEPTSPCRTVEDLQDAHNTIQKHPHLDGIASVSELAGSSNPNKLLKLSPEKNLHYYKEYNKNHSNRQFNPEYVTCNGLYYLKNRKSIVDDQRIISNNTKGLIIKRPTANIDTLFDLEYAEWLINRQRKD